MRSIILTSVAILALVTSGAGQYAPGRQSTANVKVLSHLPLGGWYGTADLEMEQEISRPYAYVARWGPEGGFFGFDIIEFKDPTKAKLLYRWVIENPELHQGHGAVTNHYFKLNGRYYDVEGFQFRPGGPDPDLGAVVVDVTGLPDTSKIREAGRIRTPDTPGGFHNLFTYKHSDGRALLFATVESPPTTPHGANVYDMERFLAGDTTYGLTGRIPLLEPRGGVIGGYHDIFVGYDPASHQDRFYGGGPEVTSSGGFYVYDVTNPADPRLLTSIVGSAGQTGSHTFVPTPDGRYAIVKSGGLQPLKVFDLKPGLDGQVKTINRAIGAWWTADFATRNYSHEAEIRWPYVFVPSYEDGMYVVNMMDPANPYTVGFYDTYDGPHEQKMSPKYFGRVTNGGWAVDVRNADGLIVSSDMRTGFWVFKLDGFDGWNGHQWGMPNVSTAQDWDNGPDGAPKPARVSLR